MEFVARVPASGLDPAMLLFQLRRARATGTFIAPPKGGSDMQIVGDVAEDRLEELIKTLATTGGALHVGKRHVRLTDGTEHDDVHAAEEHMGGPYTVLGTSRSDWSFGGDEDDHVIQTLFFEGKADVKQLHESTGLRVETVMRVLQRLTPPGTVRRYRSTEGAPEQYDLAGDVRRRLEAAID